MFSRKKFSDIKSLINLALTRLQRVRKKTNDELNLKKRQLAKNLQEGEVIRLFSFEQLRTFFVVCFGSFRSRKNCQIRLESRGFEYA